MSALADQHAFAISVAGIDLSGPYEDILYEAGCDDATIIVRNGVIFLDFERQGPSFSDAVGSAMHDIERAGGHVLKVERIED